MWVKGGHRDCFFFLLEKLSLRKKHLFDRKRELDLKGTEKKKEKGKENNEEIKEKVIFFNASESY